MSASHFLSIGSQSVATSQDGVAKNKQQRGQISVKVKPKLFGLLLPTAARQMSKTRRHVGTAFLFSSSTISFNDSSMIRHSICGYFH